MKFWDHNKWGLVWVSLQEIPAWVCQLVLGDFKEKPFSSDATAVIHTEVASSNKVSWKDALGCILLLPPAARVL